MNQLDIASLTKTAFSESSYVLISSIMSFAIGIYVKVLHNKYTADNDVVSRLTEENKALKALLDNPVQNVKMHDLAKEVGELKGALSVLQSGIQHVEEATKDE